LPITEERYDFVIPRSRLARPPVQEFIRLLDDDSARDELRKRRLQP
jgi:putative molybdopterin biosynthesis protein